MILEKYVVVAPAELLAYQMPGTSPARIEGHVPTRTFFIRLLCNEGVSAFYHSIIHSTKATSEV